MESRLLYVKYLIKIQRLKLLLPTVFGTDICDTSATVILLLLQPPYRLG